jgi:hypothetical protein
MTNANLNAAIEIASLMDAVVTVALDAPDTWLKFKSLATDEYRKAVFRLES